VTTEHGSCTLQMNVHLVLHEPRAVGQDVICVNHQGLAL